MSMFTLQIQGHGDNILEKQVEAGSLEEALTIACEECIEEDETGYFFETADADMDYFEEQDNFYKVLVDDEEFGVVLLNYEETEY